MSTGWPWGSTDTSLRTQPVVCMMNLHVWGISISTYDTRQIVSEEQAQIRRYELNRQFMSDTHKQSCIYLTRHFRAVPQVGSTHPTISALCGILVHILLIDFESGCHCNKMITAYG